jgi:hypothetical protein
VVRKKMMRKKFVLDLSGHKRYNILNWMTGVRGGGSSTVTMAGEYLGFNHRNVNLFAFRAVDLYGWNGPPMGM